MGLLEIKKSVSLCNNSEILWCLALDELIVSFVLSFLGSLSFFDLDVHTYPPLLRNILEIISCDAEVDLLEFKILIYDQ